jgi:hypothetical protein
MEGKMGGTYFVTDIDATAVLWEETVLSFGGGDHVRLGCAGV